MDFYNVMVLVAIYAFKPGSGVTLINCLVHIRRYFEQALEENRKPATLFLRKIQELYKIEHECSEAGMTPKQRKQEKLLRSKPIMIEMLNWMETEGIYYSERTLIGKAVGYVYARWNNMMHILDDGKLLLGNEVKNEIRSITIGRKNYLFCGNHEAAKNMCVVTSLLATCRNHNVNPRLYLSDIIEKMPYYNETTTKEELIELLPHRWIKSHPEAVIENLREKNQVVTPKYNNKGCSFLNCNLYYVILE